MIITNTTKGTIQEQVQENAKNIELLSQYIKEAYKANASMDKDETSIDISNTTIPNGVNNGFLLSTNGLLFEIVGIRENIVYINFWSDVSGPQGATGATGPRGSTGPAGPQGIQGPKGDAGATGPQGPQGATGATGPQGPKGATGPQGPKGDVGATGPQGPQGLTGVQGLRGPEGPQGIQGPQGEVGPQGPRGEAGPQGPQGIQGIQGPKGEAGAKGDNGADFKIIGTVSDTSELPSVASAGDAYFVGTQAPRLIYSFDSISNEWINQGYLQGPAGPRGNQGPQGIQGPQGEVGPQGPRGEAGPQGIQGPTGPVGAMGPQGPQGEVGPQGPQGNDGKGINYMGSFISENEYHADDLVTYNGSSYICIQSYTSTSTTPDMDATHWNLFVSRGEVGPQGATGATGPQGPQGATGATGPQGEVGPQGPAGPQGPQGEAKLIADIKITAQSQSDSVENVYSLNGLMQHQLTLTLESAGPELTLGKYYAIYIFDNGGFFKAVSMWWSGIYASSNAFLGLDTNNTNGGSLSLMNYTNYIQRTKISISSARNMTSGFNYADGYHFVRIYEF